MPCGPGHGTRCSPWLLGLEETIHPDESTNIKNQELCRTAKREVATRVRPSWAGVARPPEATRVLRLPDGIYKSGGRSYPGQELTRRVNLELTEAAPGLAGIELVDEGVSHS